MDHRVARHEGEVGGGEQGGLEFLEVGWGGMGGLLCVWCWVGGVGGGCVGWGCGWVGVCVVCCVCVVCVCVYVVCVCVCVFVFRCSSSFVGRVVDVCLSVCVWASCCATGSGSSQHLTNRPGLVMKRPDINKRNTRSPCVSPRHCTSCCPSDVQN